MNGKRARRILVAAFAVSLLIHAIVALRMQWPFAPPKDEIQIVRIEHARTLRVTRLPTPPPHTPPPVTPSPAPSAEPSATTAPRRSKPTHVGTHGPATSAAGAPRATAVPPTPTPAASPTPDCAKIDTPVVLVSKPEAPDIAAAARADATDGITRVDVLVDKNGVVAQANVTASSGNSSLDLVATSVARGAHFAPATHACKPVAGHYTFSVKWSPW